MTVEKHGVSESTPGSILIDAGAVYYSSGILAGDPDGDSGNSKLLGATRGGNVFEINRTIRRIDPDGAKGPVKGFRRLEEVVATLTVNLIEITLANLLKALAGSSESGGVITGAEIADGDYIGSIAIVGTITGFDGTTHPIICRLLNCLVDGPLSLGLSPKDEAVLTMVFTAHYAPGDLDAEPWNIEYPAT